MCTRAQGQRAGQLGTSHVIRYRFVGCSRHYKKTNVRGEFHPHFTPLSSLFLAMVANTPVLTVDNINPHIRDMEYAVRGRIAIRAEEIRDQLNKGDQLPFKTVVNCNIGNPQQLEQKPITFFRQV